MGNKDNNIEDKSQVVPIFLKDVANLTGKQTIDELVETNKEEIKNNRRVLPQILDNYIVVFNNVKREGILFASVDLSNVNYNSHRRKPIPILPKYAGDIAEYILKRTNKTSNEYDLQKIREVLYWVINEVKTIGHNPLPKEDYPYGRRNWKELKRFLEAKPQVKVNADNLQLMFFKELENLESFVSLTPRQVIHYRRLLEFPQLSKNPGETLYLAIRLRQNYKRFIKLVTDGHDVKEAERIAKSPEEYETLMVKHS